MLAFSLRSMDLVEHVVVELGAVFGFVGVGDVLAQVVDADAGAPLVDHLRGANHIVQVRAGDEALREAQSQRRFFGEVAQAFAFGEPDEGRPQHGTSSEWGGGVLTAGAAATLPGR